MKKTFIVLFALCIIFMSFSLASSTETQAPAKIDKTKVDPAKGTKSKNIKGKTETNAAQKTDKALGETSGGRIPPVGPAPGPVGRTTR